MSTQHWAGRTVVVTGAGGFIGSNFVRELVARRARVICLGRRVTAAPGMLGIRVDLTDAAALGRVFDRQLGRVDTVIHCAAMWGPAGFRYDHPATVFEANFRPAANVLRYAQRHGVARVVLLGSGEVYRSSTTSPLGEEEALQADPRSSADGYCFAKVYEEMLATAYRHEHGMTVFRPRPTGVYGPGDHFGPGADRVIPSMIARAAAGKEIVIWGDGSQTRTYLYVTDLVRAVLQMVEKNKHHTVNVGTPEAVSMRELAHLVCAALGKPDRFTFDTVKPTGRSSRTLDLSRLGEIIDFRPRGLREGLRQTVDWYLGTLR
jgi:nucleoside-diphosphate-sugar epimerase